MKSTCNATTDARERVLQITKKRKLSWYAYEYIHNSIFKEVLRGGTKRKNRREEDLGMYDWLKSKTRLLNGSAYCPEKYLNGFFTNSKEQDFASINFGYHSNTYLPDDRPTYLVCTRTIKTYIRYRKFF